MLAIKAKQANKIITKVIQENKYSVSHPFWNMFIWFYIFVCVEYKQAVTTESISNTL